jgi:small conductance mechanosensitive channel
MTAFDWRGLADTLGTLLTTWGLKVVGAIALLIIGRTVAGWARRTTRRVLNARSVDPTLVPFISSLVYYFVIAFVVIAVLGMVGVQTASMIAVLGAAGLAVGLALQGTLSNFAAGIMLLAFRPFKRGDFVEAAGVAGSVDSIQIFTTTLTTPDNVAIVIPNSGVWGGTIKNYAANENRRVDLVIGIAYDDDIGRAIEAIEQVLSRDQRVLKDPAPVIAVNELGDSSVNLVVRPWCARGDYWAVRWDLTRAIKEQLEAAGCSIPFPQRDVHMFSQDKAA